MIYQKDKSDTSAMQQSARMMSAKAWNKGLISVLTSPMFMLGSGRFKGKEDVVGETGGNSAGTQQALSTLPPTCQPPAHLLTD